MNALIAIITAFLLGITSALRPDIGIRWVFGTCIILIGTIIYFLPQYSYIAWGVGFAGIFLLIIALFHYLSKSTATIDRITISFLIFSFSLFIPVISNVSNPMEVISTLKNVIQYWGFVPLAALGFFPKQSRKKSIKLIIIVVILQAVVSLYQALFVVEWSSRLAGGDSVVGTFGGSPDGGGSSGAQTIFLTVIMSIALATYICNHIKLLHLLFIIITALIPISLNETKVFFFLMLIALIYLVFIGFRKFPVRSTHVIVFGIISLLSILTVYFLFLQHQGSFNDKTVSEYTKRVTESRSGLHIGEGREASYTRLGSIKYWWLEQLRKDNILQIFVGHGLGASKSKGVFLGKLVDEHSPYYGLMLDRTGLSMLLWDIGILGTTLFLLIFLSAWSLARKIRKLIGFYAYEGSMMLGIEVGIIILAISNLYDSYFFTNPALNAFTMLTFAYVVGTMHTQYTDKISYNQ